jgi:hypothetical protein
LCAYHLDVSIMCNRLCDKCLTRALRHGVEPMID